VNGAPVAAVTGATGFLGRWIVRALADAGWRPRLLVRRDPVHPQLLGIDYDIVPGPLHDASALRRLVSGVDVVVHAAGAIKALTRREFFTVNADATALLARTATETAPGARIVLVSSMAAREPGLSHYAASKAAGEQALRDAGGGNWVVARPSAVYGPWDRETLDLFRAAAGPLLPVLGGDASRICLVHAADAAAAVAALCRGGPSGGIYEVTDSCHQGYSWRDMAQHALDAAGGRARVVQVPQIALRAAAAVSGAVAAIRRKPAMLTTAKARELLHTDWSSSLKSQPPAHIWRPTIDLRSGFAETAAWYRRNGWIRGSGDRSR